VNAQPLSRRDDIDWLRIGATYLLFVFHGAMVFNPAPFYHIRNVDLSLGMLVLCGFISLWHMPLFFLLAGWSTQASLAVRGARGYLRERVQKLLIPLLAGIVLFGPIIKFIELKSGLDLGHTGLRVSAELQESFRTVIPSGLGVAPPFHETFLDFLPTFFTRLDRFTWSHLWFVAYLFTFSLLYLPLISWLGHRAPRLKQPSVIWAYVPALPLAVIQLTLRERWPGIQNLYNDWANVAYYSVYLLAGVVLGSQPALELVVHREWKRALVIGASVSGVLLLALLGVFTAPWVVLAGSALAGWCFVIALLGLGRAFLSSARPGLGYLRESAFPVYILHQVAIVLAGYAIIQLPLGIGAKFALILAASVSSTLVVYHFVVRRSAVVGVLFGVKPKACLLPARPRAVAAAGVVLVLVIGDAAWASPEPPTPIGVWYAEGGAAKVDVHPCGTSLCGDVVWLRSPWDEDGCEMRDRSNPEESLRDRPLVGLQVLTGLTREPSSDVWSEGRIYDPGSGKTYRCQAQLDGPDRLELRGYVGIPLIGRTTRWLREGTEGRMCQQRPTALHAALPPSINR
jgi:uncharacterized protein (DUF2147 family)